MSIYLGIDQSYTCTGFFVIDDKNKTIDFDVIKTDKTDDIFQRAREIADNISSLCIRYKPIRIALEGLAFGIRGNATRDLGGLQFVIMYVLLTHHPEIPCSIIAPTSLKKFATRSGKAKKQEMFDSLPEIIQQAIIDKNFKKSTGMFDVTDAYYLAHYAREHFS